jgi:hypothetical protein
MVATRAVFLVRPTAVSGGGGTAGMTENLPQTLKRNLFRDEKQKANRNPVGFYLEAYRCHSILEA